MPDIYAINTVDFRRRDGRTDGEREGRTLTCVFFTQKKRKRFLQTINYFPPHIQMYKFTLTEIEVEKERECNKINPLCKYKDQIVHF